MNEPAWHDVGAADGTLEGDYIVCPWHHWKYHRTVSQSAPHGARRYASSFSES